MTIATATSVNTAPFASKFIPADELTIADFIRQYQALGYRHNIFARTGDDVTFGGGVNEFRHRYKPSLIFKNTPPAWDVLCAGGYKDNDKVVVAEYRKFVNRRAGVSLLYVAELSGEELAAWINYWHCTEDKRTPLAL